MGKVTKGVITPLGLARAIRRLPLRIHVISDI